MPDVQVGRGALSAISYLSTFSGRRCPRSWLLPTIRYARLAKGPRLSGSPASLHLACWRLREDSAPAQPGEELMSFASKMGKLIASGVIVVAIAAAIFVALVNIGIISRPASEDYSFGG